MRGKKGLTLIELITMIVVVGIASTSIAKLLGSSAQAMLFITNRSELLDAADVAFAKMRLDMANIQDENAITTAESAIFGFDATDILDDAVTNTIEYYVASNTLMRRLGVGTPRPLLENVNTIMFTYYEEDDFMTQPLSASQMTRIKRIKVLVVLEKSGQTVTLEWQIKPGNLYQFGNKFF